LPVSRILKPLENLVITGILCSMSLVSVMKRPSRSLSFSKKKRDYTTAREELTHENWVRTRDLHGRCGESVNQYCLSIRLNLLSVVEARVVCEIRVTWLAIIDQVFVSFKVGLSLCLRVNQRVEPESAEQLLHCSEGLLSLHSFASQSCFRCPFSNHGTLCLLKEVKPWGL